MSVEFYRGSPGKFDSRTLSRKTLSRWTGRIWRRHLASRRICHVCHMLAHVAICCHVWPHSPVGTSVARELQGAAPIYTCVHTIRVYIYVYIYIYIYMICPVVKLSIGICGTSVTTSFVLAPSGCFQAK